MQYPQFAAPQYANPQTTPQQPPQSQYFTVPQQQPMANFPMLMQQQSQLDQAPGQAPGQAPQPLQAPQGPQKDVMVFKSPDCKITTANIPVYKLPKVRLSECVEVCHSEFDATMTSDLSQVSLAILLWMMTHVMPNIKVTDLRCNTYHEMYNRFLVAKTRLRSHRPNEYDGMLTEIKSLPMPLTNADVVDRAKERGYQEAWLQKANKKRKSHDPPLSQEDSQGPLFPLPSSSTQIDELPLSSPSLGSALPRFSRPLRAIASSTTVSYTHLTLPTNREV